VWGEVGWGEVCWGVVCWGVVCWGVVCWGVVRSPTILVALVAFVSTARTAQTARTQNLKARENRQYVRTQGMVDMPTRTGRLAHSSWYSSVPKVSRNPAKASSQGSDLSPRK